MYHLHLSVPIYAYCHQYRTNLRGMLLYVTCTCMGPSSSLLKNLNVCRFLFVNLHLKSVPSALVMFHRLAWCLFLVICVTAGVRKYFTHFQNRNRFVLRLLEVMCEIICIFVYDKGGGNHCFCSMSHVPTLRHIIKFTCTYTSVFAC